MFCCPAAQPAFQANQRLLSKLHCIVQQTNHVACTLFGLTCWPFYLDSGCIFHSWVAHIYILPYIVGYIYCLHGLFEWKLWANKTNGICEKDFCKIINYTTAAVVGQMQLRLNCMNLWNFFNHWHRSGRQLLMQWIHINRIASGHFHRTIRHVIFELVAKVIVNQW